MKNSRPSLRPLTSSIARICSLVSLVTVGVYQSAHAANDLYWDTNGITTGSGATSGVWGVNSFWNTDALGGNAGVFQLGTASINDLHFSAGTNATSGSVGLWGPFPMFANSVVFEENVAVSLLGSNNASGIALGTGNGGISVGASVAAATTVAVPLLLNASSTITNSGSGLLTVNGPIALASNAALTITGPGSTTIASVISGGSQFGTTALAIGGGATVSLTNGGNTFRGNIAIDGAGSTLVYTQGTVTTGSQLGVSNGTGYKQVLLSNGGMFRVTTVDFNDNVPTTTNLAAGVVLNVGTGGGTMDVTLGRTFTIDDGNVSNTPFTTTAAQLQGSGTLTKTGTGTLSLGNGTSNYSGFTGTIVVAGGVLQTGAVSTSPFGSTTAGTTVQSGASINVNGVSIGAEPLNLIGTGFAGRGALYSSAANGSVSGAITLSGNTTFGATAAAAGLTISGVVSGTANVNKVGSGAVGFNQANTFNGTVTVNEGNINVNGAAGRFTNATAATAVGGGNFNIGDATAANGLANRFNTAIQLNLGDVTGGGNVTMVRGSTTASSQSFTALNLGSGLSSITNSGTTGGVPTLTFSGASPYTRSVGGILNATSNANMTTTFTSAPSGAGNVSGGATSILVGGVLNSDNFIAAGAGSLAATTYAANTFGTGTNTQVTSSFAPAAGSVTQAIAFSTGANTVTLSGTNTIESGGIIVQTAATSGTITGGSLQAAAGKDLWIFANSKPLTIASSIVDNGGSSLTVGGSLTTASFVTLTGSNTYTGGTQLHTGATLTLSNPAVNNTTLIGNITIGSHNTAALALGASDQIADTSAITFNSGSISGQSGFLRLAGFNETVASIATVTNPLGSASVIENTSATISSVLTVSGSATTTYDGIIRNGAVGTMGLTLAGTTNLTLTNLANVSLINYTGPTIIGASAILSMYDSNAATIASFASPITNNGTLSLTNTNVANNILAVNRTLAQPVSGAGTLNINADVSTITLSGANVHTGATNINSGTLILSNAAAQSLPGQISGAGGLSQTGAGAITVSNATNNYSGPTSATAGALIFQNHSLPSGSAVTVGAAGTLSILDNGAGSNSTLAYGNTFSPSSTTSTLNVGANGGANTGNTIAFGNLLVNGATATTTTFTGVNAYKVSFTGITLPTGTGNTTILTPTTTSVSVLGDVTNPMVNYGTANFDTLQLDGTSAGNSIAGNISDAIGGSFTNPLLGGYTRILKTNTSTWTLSGTGSTYSGITQVQGGTLIAGANNVIPLTNIQGIQISNAAASATAIYDLGGFNQTLNTLGGTGTAISFAGAAVTNAGTVSGVSSTLTINGGVTYTATNNPLGATLSVGTLDLGGGNRTFTIGDSTTAAIDLSVTSLVQNGTITKTGAGTMQLTQAPTAAVVLNQGVLDLNGNTLTSFTTNGGGTVQNGIISGAAFLKQGPGTLTLAATTTGVSTVTVNQGLLSTTANPAAASTIVVNFGNAGATNTFASGSALNLGGSANNLVGGGTLSFTGFASGTNSQTFASTLIDAGANGIGGTIGAGGTLAVSLGTVSRNIGGTVNFTIPTGTQSATNGIIIGGTPAAGTLVTSATGAAYATAGGDDWAANSTVSQNNIVSAAVAGAADTSLYTAATNAATFSGEANVTAAFTATSDSTVNSIRFNTGALTLTLAGTNTITTGGILIGSGTSGVTTITGGTIQPGAGVGELALIINKPNVQAVISSVIADNGATPTAVTFRGNPNGGTIGSIIGLAANNTYTGPTYVTSGRLQAITAGVTTPFGTGTVYVDGNADGQVFINQNVTITNPFVIIGTGFNENGTRRGALRLDSAAANTPTLSGPITLMGDTTIGNNAAITGAGFASISGSIGTSNAAGSASFALTKVGTGIIKLSGTNSQTNTLLTAGVINVNADAALGIAGAPITFNGGTLQYQNSFTIDAARPVVLTGTGIVDTGLLATTSTTLSNVISGAGAFTKSYATQATNTAPLVLTGNNTFTGNVTATSGWLTATSSTSFGLGAKTITAATNLSSDSIHLDPSLGLTPTVGIDLPANMAFSTSNDTFTGANDGTIVNDSGDNIIRGNFTLNSGGGGTIFASKAGTITFAGAIAPNQTGRALKIRGDGAGVISGVIADGTTVQLPITRDLGTGTWTFSGANTYSGLTTVSTGTLKLGNRLALGFGGLTTAQQATLTTQSNLGTTVAAGATLDLAGTTGINEAITLNGTGVGTLGALINSNASTPAVLEGNIASAAVSVPGTTAATTTVTIAGGGGTGALAVANLGVSTASYTITNAGAGYTSVPTVAITAGGGAGATATVILSGGTTGTVTGLTITAPGTSFNAAATYTLTGGGPTTAAVLTGAFAYQVNSVSVTASGSGYTSAPTFTIGNATATPQMSAVVLGSDSTIGGVGDITIGGGISGGFGITKVGNGKLTLNGAGTYTGAVNLNNGMIIANAASALGTGTTTVAPSATLISGAGLTNPITLNGGTLGAKVGTGILTNTLTVSASSSVIVADPLNLTSENELQLSGLLAGSGNISVSPGTSALTPDGRPGFRLIGTAASTYSGTITVAQGAKFEVRTTVAGPFSPLGTGKAIGTGGTFTNDATPLDGTYPQIVLRNNSAGNTTFGNDIELAGTGLVVLNSPSTAPAGSITTMGNLKLGGGQIVGPNRNAGTAQVIAFNTVTLTGGNATFAPNTLGVGFSGSVDLSLGTISETAASGIVMDGLATLVLGAANNYTGSTTIQRGTTKLGAAGALPATTALNVTGGTLDLNNGGTSNNQTVASLAGLAGGTITNSDFNIRTLTVNETSGSTEDAGAITGAIALTKQGGGTLILSGTDTFTGATTISAGGGSLIINGSLSGSAVTVNGGILGGSGIISQSVTVNTGGTIAPGNSAGILSTGALNLASGSTFAVELNGTTAGSSYDQINVTGSITLGGSLSLTLGYAPAASDVFWIGLNDGADAISGVFSNVPVTDFATNSGVINVGGTDYSVFYSADFATNSFTGGNDLLVVPEPGSAVMLLSGIGMLLARRRRKA